MNNNINEGKSTALWLQIVALLLVIVMALNVIQLVLLVNVRRALREQPANIVAVETTQETEETDPIVEETTAPEVEETETTEPEESSDLVDIEYVTEPTVSIPEPTETIPPTQTDISTAEMSEREMLACVIYQEAGGDAACDECRRRVGDIVLNRIADPRFPNTMLGVLTAPSQYGRFHWTGVVWPGRATNSVEAHAVERAYRIADEILAGQHSDLYGNGYIWQAEFVQGSGGFWHCGHYFAK